jgi:hypothetical protein
VEQIAPEICPVSVAEWKSGKEMRPPAGIRLFLLIFSLLLTASADTLRLRDGSTVSGNFAGATADDIRFSVNGQVQHYARADVAGIDFSPAPADAPATSAEPDWILRGPDYANAPFLRGASGFIALEHELAAASRAGGIYGIGGGTVYRVQGGRSPVRVRQGDRIVFVVRVDSGGDPRQFQLFRLESRMGSRQTQPAMNGSPPGIPMTITRVGESVYEITPSRGLAPGEYAVSPLNSNDSYCFGVDY